MTYIVSGGALNSTRSLTHLVDVADRYIISYLSFVSKWKVDSIVILYFMMH